MRSIALFRFWLILLALVAGMPSLVFACCCIDEPVKTTESAHDCCDSEKQAPEQQSPEHCEDCACDLLIPGQHVLPIAFADTQLMLVDEATALTLGFDSLFDSLKEKVPTPPPRLQA